MWHPNVSLVPITTSRAADVSVCLILMRAVPSSETLKSSPERPVLLREDDSPSTYTSIGHPFTVFRDDPPYLGVETWMVGLPVSVKATPVDTLAWAHALASLDSMEVNLSWILKLGSSSDVRVVNSPAA